MKNIYITLLLFTLNGWSQKSTKDTLFFKYNCNYISVEKKNIDNYHFFKFKNEKLVTSAFGKKIFNEDLFYFVQAEASLINSNPRKIYSLKTYLRKRSNVFKDKSTNKYDSYKLMLYFDKFVVFFLKDKKFIKVKVLASSSE